MENAAGSTPESVAIWCVTAMSAAQTFIAPSANPVPASAMNSRTRPVLISRPVPEGPSAAGRQYLDGPALRTMADPASPRAAVARRAMSGLCAVASHDARRGPTM